MSYHLSSIRQQILQPESTNATENNEQDGKTKYNTRHQQVRDAQKRHRQRKVERIKELELSTSSLRDRIVDANHDVDRLKQENETMRRLLNNAQEQSQIASLSNQTHPQQHSSSTESVTLHNISTTTPTLPVPEAQCSSNPTGFQAEMTMVSIAVDENLGRPRFFAGSNSNVVDVVKTGLSNETGSMNAEEHTIINLILALESVCWGHFQHGDFHQHEKPQTRARGHMLMASAFYMQDAPDQVYSQRRRFHNPFQSVRNRPQALTWNAYGPTLQGLWELATSLNTGDVKVTPIQAWFELAEQYPLEVLFQPGLLQNLASEMRGAMRCVIYGASIERTAFESIAQRVLGSLPESSQKLSIEQGVT